MFAPILFLWLCVAGGVVILPYLVHLIPFLIIPTLITIVLLLLGVIAYTLDRTYTALVSLSPKNRAQRKADAAARATALWEHASPDCR